MKNPSLLFSFRTSFFVSVVLLFLLLRARDVFLHPRQVVVDCIRRRGRGRWAVHAFPELVLDGGAAGGIEACWSPASYTEVARSASICHHCFVLEIHTEDAGHDGDTRILGLALGIVHPERFQRGETDGLCAPWHVVFGVGFFFIRKGRGKFQFRGNSMPGCRCTLVLRGMIFWRDIERSQLELEVTGICTWPFSVISRVFRWGSAFAIIPLSLSYVESLFISNHSLVYFYMSSISWENRKDKKWKTRCWSLSVIATYTCEASVLNSREIDSYWFMPYG